jgi:peptide/nickel transport system permease protein
MHLVGAGDPIGILSAIRRNSFSSRSAMLLAIVGVSMPVFWLGQLLLYVFWFKLGIMPSSGLEIGASIWDSILQGKFILPWITVAVGYAAFYARMVRGNLIETMSDDYIRTARAKGMSERRVIFKHGLRGAHPHGHDARSHLATASAGSSSRRRCSNRVSVSSPSSRSAQRLPW